MKRTTIMHVLHRMGAGGTELALRRVVAGLDPQRFDNIICTVAPIAADDADGLQCVSLDRQGRKTGSLVADFARVFLKHKPDVVHSRNWGAIEAVVAAKLTAVPRTIHSEHGRDIHTMNGDPLRRRVFRRFAYALADKTFAVSRELREHYAKQVGIPASRIELIPNGVDTKRFRPDEASRLRMRALLGIPADAVVAGTVGRLDPVKDHATLLHATELLAAQGNNIHIIIVGDGPEHEMLRTRISGSFRLGELVHLTGESAHPEQWLNAFDVFVLPSLSEGMSNTILEAMATALPCVVTSVGANPDLVEEGQTGFQVQPRDAAAISERILRLAGDAGLRAKLGRAGRRKVENDFSMAQMLANYSRLYALDRALRAGAAA